MGLNMKERKPLLREAAFNMAIHLEKTGGAFALAGQPRLPVLGHRAWRPPADARERGRVRRASERLLRGRGVRAVFRGAGEPSAERRQDDGGKGSAE